MNYQINRLINFGLQKGLIETDDIEYSVNMLLDVLQLDSFEFLNVEEKLTTAVPILEEMLEYSVEKGIIDDSITEKDLFDTRIMNCIMPRPNEVVNNFTSLYEKEGPNSATDYFYNLSIASNYIRKTRTDKNIFFTYNSNYGEIEITINISKPEKDPKEILKAKNIVSTGYPKCALCKENVGFKGDFNRAARQTHRIIPIELDRELYYLQYSPYVYYNEHCIVLNKEHIPMKINISTISKLFSFVEQFPHYMIGSNADLPIVGGSILSHDHFQGGRYTFPIENARILYATRLEDYPLTSVELLKWPLSTIRLTSTSKEEILKLSATILEKWKNYSNIDLNIINKTDEVEHNTVTPIVRYENGEYIIYLTLRNNRTSEEFPYGIFHPHESLHHIKRENIGLIEVMGLAILPARLKTELELLGKCLLGKDKIEKHESLEKHYDWYKDLKNKDFNEDNIKEFIEDETAKVFVKALDDCGVFKIDERGSKAFIEFVESI
ncbi:MAG: UDP-glucose--hexose-1-phosphate uridylyltransferase [Miniphocaeibacter sp.]|uniref:UDP-glucose--hexose-1-phosphate uridylyltransferase n=1 Tax=Miniphocaeibacter sp. TaxID=3100973 RepID=UPI0017E073B5|nr:UDP-glucose--hexose-1-phosphate uridylyltransferase [Gallicola sp.]